MDNSGLSGKIGITTTIPVEVVFAAGLVPVDLNNIFITSPDPASMVARAEGRGLPRNLCSWVKGIYAALLDNPDISTVIAVTEGDCANTLSMLDLLSASGLKVITFAYPHNRDPRLLHHNIARLEARLGVNRSQTEQWRHRLNRVRGLALEVDRLTWQEHRVTGFENHLAQICLSDFNGNPHQFARQLEELIAGAQGREPSKHRHRLGYCGVPPVFSDLYDYLESMGAGVVYNEMQHQFAMPGNAGDVVEQYMEYTYPYSFDRRIADIKSHVSQRKLDGLIHYIQSFCHHQIQDSRLRDSMKVPMLTLEGDKPGPLMERNCIRLESFIEMLGI